MAEPLKLLFNDKKLEALAVALSKQFKAFDQKKFLAHFSTKQWKNAELKARVRLVTEALHYTLPKDFSKAIDILIPVSHQLPWGYFGVFFPDFVEVYGMEHWEVSMKALSEFTQTSSGEFAIRPFIVKDEKKAMKQMLQWSKNRNYHIRRFSSEGCRPRLPWGMRLHRFVEDPSPIIPVLENLKDDSELYVRKSVANNLNDISKDHPDLVLDLAKDWVGQSENTDWIIRHALRSLLKQGNKKALALFGHHDADGFGIANFKLGKKKISIGDELHFSFTIINEKKKNLEGRIEYAVDYMKANGKSNRKVFQVSRSSFSPGESVFKRKQRFQDFTTRKHYPGKHKIHILVNGEVLASQAFDLEK